MADEFKEIIQQIMEAYEQKDLDKIMSSYAEDMTFTDTGIHCIKFDRREYTQLMRSLFAGVEHLKIVVRNIATVDANTSLMEYKLTFKYVKDVEYFPVKASGQDVTCYGCCVIKLENGKTYEVRQYGNYYWGDRRVPGLSDNLMR